MLDSYPCPECLWTSSVAFSADLTMIAARIQDNVTAWRIRPNGPEQVWESYSPDGAISMALSHDGALLFMTSLAGFHVWSTDDYWSRFLDVEDIDWFWGSFKVSADWTVLACGGADHVYLWHKDKGRGIQNVMRHYSDIVVLSHNASLIISGSHDKCLYVWSKNTFKPKQRLVDNGRKGNIHPTPTQMVEQSLNSALIALCDGSQIQLWRSDRGQHMRTLKASGGWLCHFAFSNDSDLLAARPMPSGDIWLWSTRTGNRIHVFSNQGALDGPMSFSPDSILLALVCNNEVVIYCIDTGRQVQSFVDAELRAKHRWHRSRPCRCFAMFSPDSTLIVAVFCYGNMCIWCLHSGTCIRTLPCYLEETRMPVAFSHDSQLMACVVDKKCIQLSRVYTREDIGTFEISGRYNVKSVAFLPLSSILAVITVEGALRLWSFNAGCCTLNTRTRMDTRHLGFQPSTGRLFTDFGTLRLKNKKALFSEGWGFSQDRCWITCYGRPVIWLPLNYRPHVSFVRGSTLTYSTKLGRVVVLRLKPVMRTSTPVALVSITNRGEY